MNMQKLTQKSMEALQNAQRTAQEYGNSQVEQSHLLHALCATPDGLISELMRKLGWIKEGQMKLEL